MCAGEPLTDSDGELVCVKPFPSQPTHFWNDDDGIKYTKAYFSMFKSESFTNWWVWLEAGLCCRCLGSWRLLHHQL